MAAKKRGRKTRLAALGKSLCEEIRGVTKYRKEGYGLPGIRYHGALTAALKACHRNDYQGVVWHLIDAGAYRGHD